MKTMGANTYMFLDGEEYEIVKLAPTPPYSHP